MNFGKLAELENANPSKCLFWDDAISCQELGQIFACGWTFLAHDSLLAKLGDFLTTYISEDWVIVAREMVGTVSDFLNFCTHRGNLVAHAGSGDVRSFVCNYYGWSFGLDGSLVNVPLQHAAILTGKAKPNTGCVRLESKSFRGFLLQLFR